MIHSAVKLPIPPKSCQVYTPSPLAQAMVQALNNDPKSLWLEPSHGRGVFLDALANVGVPKDQICALDLDPNKSPADALASTTRGVDFLRWSFYTEQRFDRIIGNPPFAAIKSLPTRLQISAAGIKDLDGFPIGRGANLWYAFVVASLKILREGGSLGFVLPSSAEYADYSLAIRAAVRSRFRQLELHRCNRPLFANVQEGTVVAIGRGYGEGPCQFRRKEYDEPEKLIASISNPLPSNGRHCLVVPSNDGRRTVRLGNIAEIRLGGVTGDARYFLLKDDKRVSLGLPRSAVIPVVTRAKHLKSAILTEKAWESLRLKGERVWLFNPVGQSFENRSVQRYLRLAEDRGGCNRSGFKVSRRTPWYRTPLPKAPHAFISGMGAVGPWICFNEKPGLNATNTLYVVTFNDTVSRNQRYGWSLALLSSFAQRQLRRLGRQYADGLVKYEPGTLANIELPRLKIGLQMRPIYVKAVRALIANDRSASRRIADAAILENSSSNADAYEA